MSADFGRVVPLGGFDTTRYYGSHCDYQISLG
jgi:hypothetical protein